MIKASNDFVTQQGVLRDGGLTDNVITDFLDGTPSQGMRTDDFMFYYADIQVEGVQYGNRVELCNILKNLQDTGAGQDEIFEAMT